LLDSMAAFVTPCARAAESGEKGEKGAACLSVRSTGSQVWSARGGIGSSAERFQAVSGLERAAGDERRFDCCVLKQCSEKPEQARNSEALLTLSAVALPACKIDVQCAKSEVSHST
jgi:hypothetical protein